MSFEMLCLCVAFASVIVATAALIEVRELKGKIEMLQAAPVLRQYVERYVPYDNSEEAQKALQARMQKTEESFEQSLGLATAVNGADSKRRKFAEANILRAEELV